ncbi:MAG: DUF4136 domain-containing protein [Brumimicrobium sp.]|nr:DUF4136 domain-containing protein [Brumimicrobium sp.]
MKRLKILSFATILALLTACATNVYTVNPSNNDLSKYESFAYLPNTNIELEGRNYTDTMINRAVVESVKMNLQEHGMELDRDKPDLLVLISTSTDVEIAADTDPVYATYPYHYGIGAVSPFYDPYYYYGYHNYSRIVGYNTTTYSYKEGTLVIDLIDRETKQTVWKGVASREIYDQPSSQAIQKMVDDIFDEFPVEKSEMS